MSELQARVAEAITKLRSLGYMYRATDRLHAANMLERLQARAAELESPPMPDDVAEMIKRWRDYRDSDTRRSFQTGDDFADDMADMLERLQRDAISWKTEAEIRYKRVAELEAVNIELQRQGEATELDRLKLQARVAELTSQVNLADKTIGSHTKIITSLQTRVAELEEELGRDQLRLKEEAQETVRLQEIIIAELEDKQ